MGVRRTDIRLFSSLEEVGKLIYSALRIIAKS
jgi:hypothetical protein